jgi:hypothetical protein
MYTNADPRGGLLVCLAEAIRMAGQIVNRSMSVPFEITGKAARRFVKVSHELLFVQFRSRLAGVWM